jgi:hypothetical protein
MVIDNFDICCSFAIPPETNPPLLVDPDTVLPVAIAAKFFQPVRGQPGEVFEPCGGLQNGDSPPCLIREALEGADPFSGDEFARLLIGAAFDHSRSMVGIRGTSSVFVFLI